MGRRVPGCFPPVLTGSFLNAMLGSVPFDVLASWSLQVPCAHQLQVSTGPPLCWLWVVCSRWAAGAFQKHLLRGQHSPSARLGVVSSDQTLRWALCPGSVPDEVLWTSRPHLWLFRKGHQCRPRRLHCPRCVGLGLLLRCPQGTATSLSTGSGKPRMCVWCGCHWYTQKVTQMELIFLLSSSFFASKTGPTKATLLLLCDLGS